MRLHTASANFTSPSWQEQPAHWHPALWHRAFHPPLPHAPAGAPGGFMRAGGRLCCRATAPVSAWQLPAPRERLPVALPLWAHHTAAGVMSDHAAALVLKLGKGG